jgi:hypothetical protein
MKQKIIIVDLIGTIGHANWLNKLFSIIQDKFDITFIGYKSFCKHLNVEHTFLINEKYSISKNKYHNLINQIKAISQTKKIIEKFDNEIPLYIVGFENIS